MPVMNSVMTPAVVIWPIWLPPLNSVNQRLPSGRPRCWSVARRRSCRRKTRSRPAPALRGENQHESREGNESSESRRQAPALSEWTRLRGISSTWSPHGCLPCGWRECGGRCVVYIPLFEAPKRKAQERVLGSKIIPRQRPTLPRGLPRSTIGAEGLNGRVRNGNGCGPFAKVTGKLCFQSFPSIARLASDRESGSWGFGGPQGPRPGQESRSRRFSIRALNILWSSRTAD